MSRLNSFMNFPKAILGKKNLKISVYKIFGVLKNWELLEKI